MNKRIVATITWLFAGWYLGNFIAWALGIDALLGPILGVATAILVGVDPLGVIWTARKPATEPMGEAVTA